MANQRGSRITGLRLRTKLQLSLLLISALLTCGTLLIVHQIVMAQVRRQIFDDLQNSVATFRNLLRQREVMRARSAALISNLPNLKALMTSHDAATIQDASQGTWDLAGSDLFILGDRDGKVLALHTSAPGFTRGMAEAQIRGHASEDQMGSWWFGGGRLYQVFLQPIYFGSEKENHVLGVLAMGYEVDERLAHEVSRIAGSEVNITYGDSVIATTLRPSQESDLSRVWRTTAAGMAPLEITLDGERFLTTRLSLESSNLPEAALTILKSYDQAASFLNRLNRMVLGIGITAVVLGSLLIYLISLNFTRPLENLAAGVKALGAGDFRFPLESRGNDEVALVTNAFDRMRRSLQVTQQKLLESERLATIGLMASSISHDLRHPLTAILANAEFLLEGNLSGNAREDLYQEIRFAVNRMTDLIDSLLEFSRGRESLHLSRGRLEDAIARAVQAMRTHPEFSGVAITTSGNCSELWFDQRRLERALYNVLLNACEAARAEPKIKIALREADSQAHITVSDNGPGIAEPIRQRLFEPFVSFGKENGTGLGLTIAQKILEDHGGQLRVASTSLEGTSFEMMLPRNPKMLATSMVHLTVSSGSSLVWPKE